jgi:hypothetical protein
MEGFSPQTSILSSIRHWLLALVPFVLYTPSLTIPTNKKHLLQRFLRSTKSTASMKFTTAIALLAATVAAVPTGLERRQLGGMTENELKDGTCKKITLVYARGSTEMGNMVSTPTTSIYQICNRSSS